jgi:hypothetical protein
MARAPSWGGRSQSDRFCLRSRALRNHSYRWDVGEPTRFAHFPAALYSFFIIGRGEPR